MRRRADPGEGFGYDLRRRRRSRLRAAVEGLAVAALAVALLRALVVQGIRISSPSMEPTLLAGDCLFASRIEYGARLPLIGRELPALRGVRPGDIVIFEPPAAAPGGRRSNDYIKRVVAVAGQTVEMRHRRLFVDGQPGHEPYAVHRDPASDPLRDSFPPLIVPPGHCFVLGDNRDASDDSRYWGPLPISLVHGRAFIRYFSWDPDRKRVRFERMPSRLR